MTPTLPPHIEAAILAIAEENCYLPLNDASEYIHAMKTAVAAVMPMIRADAVREAARKLCSDHGLVPMYNRLVTYEAMHEYANKLEPPK